MSAQIATSTAATIPSEPSRKLRWRLRSPWIALRLLDGQDARRLAPSGGRVGRRPLRERDLGRHARALRRVGCPPPACRRARPRGRAGPACPSRRRGSAPPLPSSDTSTYSRRRRPARRRSPTWPRRACRCSPGTPTRRSRPPPRPGRAAARPGVATTSTGTVARGARSSSAAGSPRFVRIAGWMPRARSRSSLSASCASSPAWRTSSAAPGSPASTRCSAMRRFSASATSRCCAPSCRSRSIRRRSASAAAMMRERASSSSCTWAVSAGSAFEPSSRPANHPYSRPSAFRPGMPSSRMSAPSGTAAIEPAVELMSSHAIQSPSPKGSVERGCEQQPQAESDHRDGDREAHDPERKLEQQEGEVLPGGRVGDARARSASTSVCRAGRAGTGSGSPSRAGAR